MKKTIALLFALMLIVTASACAQNVKGTSAAPAGPANAPSSSLKAGTDEYAEPSAVDIDPLYPVKLDGKWGFIDKTGELVIEPSFDNAKDFSEGLSAVCMDGLWGYIDKTGAWVIEPQYNSAANSFSDGLAFVVHGDPVFIGYIDADNNKVLVQPDDDATQYGNDFSEGYAAFLNPHYEHDAGLGGSVFDHSDYGYMDRAGNVVIEPAFANAREFMDGVAPAQDPVTKLWGLIDTDGNYLIAPQFGDMWPFHEGLSSVMDKDSGYYGYINLDGEYVISPQYGDTYEFQEGFAYASDAESGLYGFIDKTGEWVIQPQYESASDFYAGLAMVTTVDGTLCYINQNNDVIWDSNRADSAIPSASSVSRATSFDDNGFVFYDSDRRNLSDEDLQGLDAEMLGFARNEIFARYGNVFKKEKYRQHYEQYDWYNALEKHEEVGTESLNEVERANVAIIQKFESMIEQNN